MQVQKINNQNIQGIKIGKCGNKLMERFDINERYIEFCKLDRSQNYNPINIQLDLGKYRNIKGTIVGANGKVLFTKTENPIFGLLNTNPIRFLRKLCKTADKINTGKC